MVSSSFHFSRKCIYMLKFLFSIFQIFLCVKNVTIKSWCIVVQYIFRWILEFFLAFFTSNCQNMIVLVLGNTNIINSTNDIMVLSEVWYKVIFGPINFLWFWMVVLFTSCWWANWIWHNSLINHKERIIVIELNIWCSPHTFFILNSCECSVFFFSFSHVVLFNLHFSISTKIWDLVITWVCVLELRV